MKSAVLYIVFISLLFSACNLINPHEQIPGYLNVSSFRMKVDSFKEGTSSQKITDVWVDVNNTFAGAYQLPATFPILEVGQANLVFRAGVKIDGISSRRAPYPFYAAFDTTVNISATKVDSIKPVFKYAPQTIFNLVENFEGSNPKVDTVYGVSLAKSNFVHNYGYASSGSLGIDLNSKDSSFEVWTKASFPFVPGQIVWMELNYQTDIPINFGVYAVASRTDAYKIDISGVNPSANWNKVYVNLSDAIVQAGTERVFLLYINGSLLGKTEGHVHLDNIKILSLHE